MPKSYWVRSRSSAATTFGLPTTKDTRAPVRLKDLDSEKNSTPTSFAPGIDRNE